MTDIAFHFNVADKLDYACRLLRKAWRAGPQVGVVGEAELLGRLDRELWCFEPLEFIPHASTRAASQPQGRHTRIWLGSRPQDFPHHGVLVNLGAGVPEGFERFDRLIEIVGLHPEDRQQARRRWKHYADAGYEIARHEVGASEGQG
jgi:DNA polymerase-3 subunit chi